MLLRPCLSASALLYTCIGLPVYKGARLFLFPRIDDYTERFQGDVLMHRPCIKDREGKRYKIANQTKRRCYGNAKDVHKWTSSLLFFKKKLQVN